MPDTLVDHVVHWCLSLDLTDLLSSLFNYDLHVDVVNQVIRNVRNQETLCCILGLLRPILLLRCVHADLMRWCEAALHGDEVYEHTLSVCVLYAAVLYHFDQKRAVTMARRGLVGGKDDGPGCLVLAKLGHFVHSENENLSDLEVRELLAIEARHQMHIGKAIEHLEYVLQHTEDIDVRKRCSHELSAVYWIAGRYSDADTYFKACKSLCELMGDMVGDTQITIELEVPKLFKMQRNLEANRLIDQVIARCESPFIEYSALLAKSMIEPSMNRIDVLLSTHAFNTEHRLKRELKYAHYLRNNDKIDEAIAVLNTVLEHDEVVQYVVYTASLLLSQCYMKLKDYNTALQLLRDRLMYAESNNHRSVHCSIYQLISFCYFLMENKEMGVAFAEKAEELAVRIGNTNQAHMAAFKLGLYISHSSYSLGMYNDNGTDAFLRALSTAVAMDSRVFEINTLICLARRYWKKKEYTSAMSYYADAVAGAESERLNGGADIPTGPLYKALGIIHRQIGENVSSLENLMKAITSFKRSDDVNELANTYIQVAYTYEAMMDYIHASAQLLLGLQWNPNESIQCVLHFRLGLMFERMDKALEKRREEFKTALCLAKKCGMEMIVKGSENGMSRCQVKIEEVFVKPEWQPDKDAITCNLCMVNFGVFTRRHHCRACGRVFCNDCCHVKIKLPFYDVDVRVCEKCLSELV